MSKPISGGCMCGAVRYEISSEPLFAGHCHCRACQQAGGAGGASAIAVPTDALKITGEVRFYGSPTDSGGTSNRGFCPTCGSRLVGRSTGMPGMTTVTAGSLDDPSIFKPTMNVFTNSAPPWDVMDPDLPKFPGMPEMPE